MDDEEEEDGRACTSKQHSSLLWKEYRYIMIITKQKRYRGIQRAKRPWGGILVRDIRCGGREAGIALQKQPSRFGTNPQS
jgi:hypothetical protein